MNANCYILFSNTLNKFYVGATQDDLPNRIQNHNNHSYGSHRFTAKAKDWHLFLAIPANDYSHAIRIERKIKSMKSRKYIENLNRYSELREKIIEQTTT